MASKIIKTQTIVAVYLFSKKSVDKMCSCILKNTVLLLIVLILIAKEERILAAPQHRGDMVEEKMLPEVTPYPLAGIRPEVPFELPTETMKPTPDPVYGPPPQFTTIISISAVDDLSDHLNDPSFIKPDIVYGPPLLPDVNREPNEIESTTLSIIEILPKVDELPLEDH